MQKIRYALLWMLPVCLLAACTKNDNYSGPNAAFKGQLIDSTTNTAFLTETSGIQIKLEELSWSATPTPQYIPVQPDGSFEDTKLFGGHYRVTPVNGAFWPVSGVEMDINGSSRRDFRLVPYLKITNFHCSLSGNTLVMHFNLTAPVTQGLPQLIDIKPFVNTTPYVGSGSTISQYTDPNKADINSNWSDAIAAKTFELRVPDLKQGRTFYVRAGVRVNDSYKQFNYSETVEIKVP